MLLAVNSMAERKYDLLLYNTNKYAQEQPKPQPWYRERIQTKFLQAHRSLALDSSQWKLFRSNPDDFRDGVPPPCRDILSPDSSQLHLPLIHLSQTASSSPPRGTEASLDRKRIRKKDALYCRALPAQQKRREYIEALETRLTGNPTQLYPHLREAIPEHLRSRYRDAISADSHTPDVEESVTSPIETLVLPTPKRSYCSSAPSEVQSETDIAELYRFPSARSPNKLSRPASSELEAETEDSEFSRLAGDLCSWANQLSDTQDRLEPSHLRALFSNTFDHSKLTTLAPVQVVDLSNIPGELRIALMDINQKKGTCVKRKSKSTSTSNPEPVKPVRTKYGEWYVPVNLWRALLREEHLDVSSQKDQEQRWKEGRALELDKEISELHSASLFLRHLHKKASGAQSQKVHIPSFLTPRETDSLSS